MARHDRGAGRLNAFFPDAPIGIVRIGSDGRIGSVNAEFTRLVGVSIDDALDRTPDEIVPLENGRWADVIGEADGSPELVRRTVAVAGGPNSSAGRPLDVQAWATREPGGTPTVTLLVSDVFPDQARRQSAEVDRARFGREIHDGLAQDLWLAKLAAARLHRHPSLDEDARALCAELLRSIDAGLNEVRTAVAAMSPTHAPGPPLADLVERHVSEFSDRFGIRVETHLDVSPPMPPRISLEMLRVTQEALNNVRKHADGRRVVVRLERRRGSIVLSVRDDGVGFDPAIANGGYGRQSMRERAESIGAALTIASMPGRGTTVTLRVPVAQLVPRQ